MSIAHDHVAEFLSFLAHSHMAEFLSILAHHHEVAKAAATWFESSIIKIPLRTKRVNV